MAIPADPGDKLAWYTEAIADDAEFARDSHAEAAQLVDDFTTGATVPTVVRDRAVLEVGADLYYRRASRNGIAQIDGVDMQPFRLRRDPMDAALPMLRRYVVTGIG